FIPLDPLIVGSEDWRPDSPTIDRSALALLTNIVRTGMGDQVQQIDAMIAGHTTRDTAVLEAAGILVWQAAARLLAETCPPLGPRIAALLGQEPTLQNLLAEAEIGVLLRPETLFPILRATARDATTLAMMVALVLSRLPHAADTLAEAARMLGADM